VPGKRIEKIPPTVYFAACAKCDPNLPVHITELTMALKFSKPHPSFAMQTVSGQNADCCLTKNYFCQAQGNFPNASINVSF
jgi:hypothetical protein